MLAGDRAAERRREIHDLAVGDVRPLPLGGIVRVDDEQRVRVPVTGVGDDGDEDVALGRDPLDPGDEVAEAGQRHPDILEQEGALLLHRGDRHPPRGDEGLPLLGVIGGIAFGRPVLLAQLFDDGDLTGGVLAGLVGLDDEHALGLPVEAHLQLVLDGVDRCAVHELEHRQAHLRADVEDGLGRTLERREGRHQRRRWQLGGHQPQGHLGDDAERSLAADEELEQGEPRDVLDPRTAEFDRPAVGEDDGHAEDVVRRHSVLHAAQTAGVRRDIAADRAELVRRGIRRVPEAVFGGGGLDLGVEGPGLDDGHAGRGVDRDVAHPVEADDEPALDGGAAAREPRTGAAGHDGDPRGGRDAHRRLDVGGRGRADDRQRHPGTGVVRPIPAIGVHRVRIGDEGVGGQRVPQGSEDFGRHGSPRVQAMRRRDAPLGCVVGLTLRGRQAVLCTGWANRRRLTPVNDAAQSTSRRPAGPPGVKRPARRAARRPATVNASVAASTSSWGPTHPPVVVASQPANGGASVAAR